MQPTDFSTLRLYNEPHRHYHTVHHVMEMLELHHTGSTRGITIPEYVQPYFGEFSDKEFVSAVVAHDCVYEIGLAKGENERRSLAAWAKMAGREDSLGVVEPLILCTITHEPDSVEYRNPHQEENLRAMVRHMIDLDLSGLGAAEEVFEQNSHNIKLEMMSGGTISETDYIEGRKKFFESMLMRPTIFQTDQFRNALEERARDNIRRSIA